MLERFQRLVGLKAKSALRDASPDMMALFGAVPVASGVAVSPQTAMRCPAVYACVKVISESVAQLPLHLYQRLPDGTKARAMDHPLFNLLHDQPNDWTSGFEFRLGMQEALCKHGHAFAYIGRNPKGEVRELIQIPSPSVTIKTDTVTLEPSFEVAIGDGQTRRYSRREIFHLHALGGMSPIHQMREAIGLALAMEEHGARLFGEGARPSGVFKYAKALTPDAMRRLRGEFAQAYAGGANSGKTLVLEDGMDFTPLQFNSVDLQFLELRRHQVAEIARGFRVPLHMLQDLERTTHANAESLGRQFVSFTLMPWLKAWEGGIRRALLTARERPNYYAEFLTDDLARADLASRFEAYAKAVTNGLLSPNEVRAAENRAPYVGGDQFRLPMNTEDASGGANAA